MEGPQVKLLHERVDEHEPANGESAHVHSSGSLNKYSKLETTTWDSFKLDLDIFSLHFHIEGYDRCDTKVKSRLWDDGTYFKPNLIKDGTIRLMPHFQTKRFGTSAVQKRALLTVNDDLAVQNIPQPQKRNKKSTSTISVANQAIDLTLSDSLVKSPLSIRDIVTSDITEPVPVQSKHTLEEPTNIDKTLTIAHGYPTVSRLPAHATVIEWLRDWTEAKQKYIAIEYKGQAQGRGKRPDRRGNDYAHQQMIEGKYGIVAQQPCEQCEHGEYECRVYHPACYDWELKGSNVKGQLGFICGMCRLATGTCKKKGMIGGCKARFEPV
ncbi:hypothetical protein BKA66DRAFT_446824 [Pyrenochaeta sp. MPI-SDFR-AT-0127]|nr:hypothetical protein BKA66DRAFT_446824 [Pyrenochaeta sp. MPI-SDFR-AT-0127]